MFFIEHADTTLTVELIALTPQVRFRFLASTEYLIQFGLSSHIRLSLTGRDPREHNNLLEQTSRFFNEQIDEVLVFDLVETTPQERPRFLASTTF